MAKHHEDPSALYGVSYGDNVEEAYADICMPNHRITMRQVKHFYNIARNTNAALTPWEALGQERKLEFLRYMAGTYRENIPHFPEVEPGVEEADEDYLADDVAMDFQEWVQACRKEA